MTWKSLISYRFLCLKDKAAQKIAWWLPRRVVLWAAVRVGAHATTGPYGHQVVPALLFFDAITRWESATPVGPLHVKLWLAPVSFED